MKAQAFLTTLILLISLSQFTFVTHAQFSINQTHITSKKIKSHIRRNPQALAEVLTQGLTTDKEKFDAIYLWVVSNISYDHRLFQSGKAFVSGSSVTKTLHTRMGTCLNYANLMDTLCHFAGIQNVTITGYTKQIQFDLYDSLYFDDHAWNAVKLNGLWYLYDATWSTSRYRIGLTKGSIRRINAIQKWEQKVKTKNLYLSTDNKKGSNCNLPREAHYDTIETHTLRFFPKLFIEILRWFPIRFKRLNEMEIDTTYYLTNPDVFAVTHFPNNPIWSLSQRIKTLDDFCADSASYNPAIFQQIENSRHGVFCLACDDYEAANPIRKEELDLHASILSNPRNQFIPANFYLSSSSRIIHLLLDETDSLRQFQLIDSTNLHLNLGKGYYKKSSIASRDDYNTHMKKNNLKRKALRNHNKEKLTIIRTANTQLVKHRRQAALLKSRSQSMLMKESRFLSKFYLKEMPGISTQNLNEVKKEKLKNEYRFNKQLVDSLNIQIHQLQDTFVKQATTLWRNLILPNMSIHSIHNSFQEDNLRRLMLLEDQYDYYIRQIRAEIDTSFEEFKFNLNQQVFLLSESMKDHYFLLNQLVAKRNTALSNCLKSFALLKRNQLVSDEEIRQFISSNQLTLQEEVCWRSDKAQLMNHIEDNFTRMETTTKLQIGKVNYNKKIEDKRHSKIRKHLYLVRKRQLDAITKNQKSIERMTAFVKRHKLNLQREYRKKNPDT